MVRVQSVLVAVGTRSGIPVVYMAETVSLAVLENLAQMAREDFPTGYVLVAALLTEEVRVLIEEDLTLQFGRISQRHLGDRWFDLRVSAVLRVRSAIVPFEHNYLLNPQHPDFAAIAAEPVVRFIFDERLFGSRQTR